MTTAAGADSRSATSSSALGLSYAALIGTLAGGVAVLIHLLTAERWDYFRDELYFIACGEHLAWGYVDMPPLIAAAAKVSRLAGDTLFTLRLFPALAAGAKVAPTGLIAGKLGGGRLARMLAMLAVIVAPIYLGTDALLTMNTFEPVFWMGCAYVLVRLIDGADARLWLVFGAIAGLGLENKYSMAFFGGAVILGLLLTPERRLLASGWAWAGAALALLIFMPNLAGQKGIEF